MTSVDLASIDQFFQFYGVGFLLVLLPGLLGYMGGQIIRAIRYIGESS